MKIVGRVAAILCNRSCCSGVCDFEKYFSMYRVVFAVDMGCLIIA